MQSQDPEVAARQIKIRPPFFCWSSFHKLLKRWRHRAVWAPVSVWVRERDVWMEREELRASVCLFSVSVDKLHLEPLIPFQVWSERTEPENTQGYRDAEFGFFISQPALSSTQSCFSKVKTTQAPSVIWIHKLVNWITSWTCISL